MNDEIQQKINTLSRELAKEMDEDGKISLEAYIRLFPKNYERLLRLEKLKTKAKDKIKSVIRGALLDRAHDEDFFYAFLRKALLNSGNFKGADVIDKRRGQKYKENYDLGLFLECPHCSNDKPDHGCRECHSDINKDACWKFDAHCERCFNYIHEEIPKIEALKEKLGIKCLCNDRACIKCLMAVCKDSNCFIHTMAKKKRYKKVYEK